MRLDNPAAADELRTRLINENKTFTRRLWVCGGPGCLAAGAAGVFAALADAVAGLGLAGSAGMSCELSGCLGLCEKGPLVQVEPEGWLYAKVTPADAPEIALETLSKGELIVRLLDDPKIPLKDDHPFYKPQRRLIMSRMGRTRPDSLEDYVAAGGYSALSKALSELGPGEVSRRVEASGLRGRGGGGFPAGRKWAACRSAPGPVKYVVANGDEGDPGAFMNRSLMEGDPFSVVEGMTLGAYAVGAAEGFIYVRHEYPLSVARLKKAVGTAEERGLLGENILGSGFSFKLRTVEGGGAFVCGESTALMASIEGREGQPRVKYVRSAERGLWDRPTLLQNVESWANVPAIVAEGPEWFKSIGAEGNPGTKVFSLVGQVRRSGLVETPLGTPVGTLVDGAGGGARPGRTIKAVQTGGPSGGCLPREKFDLPLDFDHLPAAGTIMGSGGLIVMDDLSCMVDVARYFTGFLSGESCGKCAPCREGLTLIGRILDDLCRGRGRRGDVLELASLGETLSRTALCGLGQSAANPLLSTIRYFAEEYREHEEEGFCRSGRCQGMFVPEIDADACRRCFRCAKVCPARAATVKSKREPPEIDLGACVSCGACLAECRFGALRAAPKKKTGETKARESSKPTPDDSSEAAAGRCSQAEARTGSQKEKKGPGSKRRRS
ncbi:MAG: 4Fe-4S dicluster domain-containing protein [Deltaproteobacteria bacterium]|jgi:NADH-quinone oxidoreductase subunit F|nr:4Fe-4S dicluster domain-containing protein [Deltaproteobacteria bacterium]